MVGRKPKPAELRRLEGNRGKRPIPDDLPEIPPAIPECPPELNDGARAEWNRVAPILCAAKVLTPADQTILAMRCVVYDRWLNAEKAVESSANEFGGAIVKAPKTGTPMQHPYLGIANRAIDQIMKMDAELGLTPSSRSRLHIQRPKEESAYEKFKARRVQPAEETPARVN